MLKDIQHFNFNKFPASKLFEESRVQKIVQQRDPNKMFKTFTTFLGEVPILTHIEKKRLKFKQEMEAKQNLRKKTIDI